MGRTITYIYCLCLPIVFSTLVTSCIVVPLDSYNYGSRQNVNEEVLNTFQPGTTTKEDVFLTLGEPDIVSAGGNCLTYTWEKAKLVWVLGGYGGAAGGTIDRRYELVLCFDDQGLLIRKELKKEFK
jgi:hypothetical protein